MAQRARVAAFAAAAAAVACLGAGPPARIVAVYPSGPDIPANLLRVTIRFAAPPDEPVLPRLSLHGAALDAGQVPFVDQELWSPDGTMLTVLFDPARLKTGVAANLAFGRVLRAGETVTLAFDHRSIKRWHVVAALQSGPRPDHWMLHAAPAGSRAAVVVGFDRAIDALDAGLMAIVSAAGATVAGEARLDPGEAAWRFIPRVAWQPGAYWLVVSPALEDASGNAVAQPFEASAAVPPPASAAPVALPFVIRPLL